MPRLYRIKAEVKLYRSGSCFVLGLLELSRNTYKPRWNETFCHFGAKVGGNGGDMF